MIIMPYGWSWPIAAAHGPSRLLAPHKLDQEDTVRERPLHVSGHVHCEPGLADATDPDQRHEPALSEQLPDLDGLRPTGHEAGQIGRKVVRGSPLTRWRDHLTPLD
jgi:hypothetical protein